MSKLHTALIALVVALVVVGLFARGKLPAVVTGAKAAA